MDYVERKGVVLGYAKEKEENWRNVALLKDH